MRNILKLFIGAVIAGCLALFVYFSLLYPRNYVLRETNSQNEISVTKNSVAKHTAQVPAVSQLMIQEQSNQASINPVITSDAGFGRLPDSHSSSDTLSHSYRGTVLKVSDQIKTEIVSAFFDLRQNRQMVAILGCFNHHHFTSVHYYCQIKYSDGNIKCLSKESNTELLSSGDENGSKNCWSYRFACTLENGYDKLPTYVALSSNSNCNSPSDWIEIYDSRYTTYKTDSSPVKKYVLGVCYQTPVYKAENLKGETLIESIERNRAMGAEWFTIYFRENPSTEAMQIFKYYEQQGIAEVVNMTISDATYYNVRYYGELIAIRDCAYRNMHRVQYLSMTDLDEVIVPQGSRKNWKEMLSLIDSDKIGAFQFKHVLMIEPPDGAQVSFTDTCPDSDYHITTPRFLTHTYRTKPFPIPQERLVRWKCIVKPLCVDKIGIHSVNALMSGYQTYSVPPSTGLLYHYRKDSFFDVKKCSDCEKDSQFSEQAPDLLNTYTRRACEVHFLT